MSDMVDERQTTWRCLMIERLDHGGYVVREAFSKDNWAAELAAFSTLNEVFRWIERHLDRLDEPVGELVYRDATRIHQGD